MANELLERVAQVKQALGGGGGQVTPPELEDLQPPERKQREGRRIPARRRQHAYHLKRGQQPKDPAQLLERPVVSEIGDVGPEVVDWGAGEEALELLQRFQPRVHVVEPHGVQLQGQRPLEERPRVALHELYQVLEVAIPRDDHHPPPRREENPNELGFSRSHHRRKIQDKNEVGGFQSRKLGFIPAQNTLDLGGERSSGRGTASPCQTGRVERAYAYEN